MSFTYDITTDRGKTRLAIGDTDSANVLFQDAEVDQMLAVYVTPLKAAAALADALAARFGQLVSQSVDGASFSYSQRSTFYMDLALRLRAQDAAGADGDLGTVFVGGISKGEIAAVEANDDRTPSSFSIGQHDDLPASDPVSSR